MNVYLGGSGGVARCCLIVQNVCGIRFYIKHSAIFPSIALSDKFFFLILKCNCIFFIFSVVECNYCFRMVYHVFLGIPPSYPKGA